MCFVNRRQEETVYISRDKEEFEKVKSALDARGVRYRVWTTAEYPVFGWSRFDPRLLGRGEKTLRKVYHIDADASDRGNVANANMAVRSVTGKFTNAERRTEII